MPTVPIWYWGGKAQSPPNLLVAEPLLAIFPSQPAARSHRDSLTTEGVDARPSTTPPPMGAQNSKPLPGFTALALEAPPLNRGTARPQTLPPNTT